MHYDTAHHANPTSLQNLLDHSNDTQKLATQLFHERVELAKQLIEVGFIAGPEYEGCNRRPSKTYHLNFVFNAIHQNRKVAELQMTVVDNGVNTPTIGYCPRYADSYRFETKALPEGPLVHKATQYLLTCIKGNGQLRNKRGMI